MKCCTRPNKKNFGGITMNVLIVDDDSIKAKWSEYYLRLNKEIENVKVVSYAEEALRVLTSEKIDFVVLDMQFCIKEGCFDKFAGLYVLKEMQSNPLVNENIPVVICSSGSYLKELDNFSNVITFLRYGHSNANEFYQSIIRKVTIDAEKNGIER